VEEFERGWGQELPGGICLLRAENNSSLAPLIALIGAFDWVPQARGDSHARLKIREP
jgi:hypothetical protein